MRLKTLRLRNIRSYVSEDINIPDGTTLLSGDIGSGKSSILLAIEFALFGIKRGTLSGGALLRNGSDTGSVELDMKIDGKDISIMRSLKKGKNNISQSAGHIIINGVKTEGTAVELKSRILQLIGYPAELLTKANDLVYRYTVYTPQEEMKQILFETSEERLDILRRLFGIDRYKRIKENAMLYLKELRLLMREDKRILEGTDEKKNILSEKKKEFTENTKALTSLKPILTEMKEKAQKDEKEIELMAEKEKASIELKKRLSVLDSRISSTEMDKERSNKEIEMLKGSITRIEKNIEELSIGKNYDPKKEIELEQEISLNEFKIKSVSEKKTSIKNWLDANKPNLADIRKQIRENLAEIDRIKIKKAEHDRLLIELEKKESLLKALESNENINLRLHDDVKDKERTISDSQTLIAKISEIDNCPTCHQEVNPDHKAKVRDREDSRITLEKENLLKAMESKNKIETDIIKLKEDIKVLQDKEKMLSSLKIELKNGNELIIKTKEMKSRFDKISDEIKVKEKSLEESSKEDLSAIEKIVFSKKEEIKKMSDLKMARQKLDMEKKNLQEKKDMFKKADESFRLASESIKKSNEEKDKFEKELLEFKDITEALSIKRKESQSHFSDLKNKESEMIIFIEREKAAKEWIEKLEKELESLRVIENKVKQNNALHNWIDNHFIKLTNDIERQVMARLHQEFSHLFETWTDMLIEDDNLNVKLKDDFSPLVLQNGHDNDLINLSGGEKTAIALAYRLALNRVVNDLISTIRTQDIIILDEPTDGFSSEQLDKVKDVMDQISAKQVLIVSHDPKIESFVENIIRIGKEDHTSRLLS